MPKYIPGSVYKTENRRRGQQTTPVNACWERYPDQGRKHTHTLTQTKNSVSKPHRVREAEGLHRANTEQMLRVYTPARWSDYDDFASEA